jgi:hypothetical protein
MVRLVVLGLASLAAVGDGVRVRREFRALSRDQQQAPSRVRECGVDDSEDDEESDR